MDICTSFRLWQRPLSNIIFCIAKCEYKRRKLLIENKLIICAFGNLNYQISREKFEPEPGFEPRIFSPALYHMSYPGSHASSCSRRSEVRISVQVRIFLLRTDKGRKLKASQPHLQTCDILYYIVIYLYASLRR